MAHTPGPWETKWPKFNCSIESRGGVVATVYIGHTLGDSESQANASLIAAAPDLLEALKALRDHAVDDTDDRRLSEAVANADAAIAKAEGRS